VLARQKPENVSASPDTQDVRKQRALECEREIRETGMVEIFEGISDRGIVILNDYPTTVYRKVNTFLGTREVRKDLKYRPAKVDISQYAPEVTLTFNESRHCYKVTTSHISAYTDGQGKLFVKGKEKFEIGKISVDEAVVKALANPFFTTGNDCS
jgi:hypothetical protein